jgi:cellulose synthase operon protein B
MNKTLSILVCITALCILLPECKRTSVEVNKPPADYTTAVLNWFSANQLDNGLLESTPGNDFVSLYDNALSALVFISNHDFKRAELIFDFFNKHIDNEFLSGTGGFSQFRDRFGVPFGGGYWLGDNAWLLIALNNYKAKTGSDKYNRLSDVIETWIRSLQDSTDGSVWQGYSNGIRTSQVTENMIDAFNAVSGYDNFHHALLSYFKNYRWDQQDKLLISAPGSYYKYALDNFTWGFCSLQDLSSDVLEKAKIFLAMQKNTLSGVFISGYCMDIDCDVVWLEGTGQMAVAFHKASQDDKRDYYVSEIQNTMISVNDTVYGIPYTTNFGTGYGDGPLWTGVNTSPCISSAAWYLFAKTGFDPLQAGYAKNIPAADKFWLK